MKYNAWQCWGGTHFVFENGEEADVFIREYLHKTLVVDNYPEDSVIFRNAWGARDLDASKRERELLVPKFGQKDHASHGDF